MKITFTKSICTPDYVYNATLELLSLVKTCNVNHTTWTIWTRKVLSLDWNTIHIVKVPKTSSCCRLSEFLSLSGRYSFLPVSCQRTWPWCHNLTSELNLSRSPEECWWTASSSLNLFLVRFSVKDVLALLPIFLRDVCCPFPFGSCLFLLNPLI